MLVLRIFNAIKIIHRFLEYEVRSLSLIIQINCLSKS